MIPRRRPPFGVGRVIKSIFDCWNRPTVEDVEKAYARAYGMPHAVLLPSGRAGICWALKATIGEGTTVLCTAYTCKVVWEAIVRSGGQLQLIDLKENSFLMDETALNNAQVGNYAIVLCEIYGYTYDLYQISQQATAIPAIRIIDMAMTVPVREHFERLTNTDVAIISLGSGKCMYTGWGGMAFTRDAKLASNVRQIRDQSLVRSNTALLLRRSLKMLALNLMYTRFTYGSLKRVKNARQAIRQHLHRHPGTYTFSSHLGLKKPLSKEWFLPSTYVNLSLMLHNLRHAEEYARERITLAHRYHNNFKGVAGITRPDIARLPMSHYPIRVKSAVRPLIRKYLSKVGIDVGILFSFPRSLSKSKFPHASKTSSKILTLPLYKGLSLGDIDRISESVVRGCLKYS